MSERDDDDLRARFEALRDADSNCAPDYSALRDRESQRPRVPMRVRAPALALALAAGLVVWLVLPEADEHEPRPATQDAGWTARGFEPGQWEMPSDALLDLSGLPGDRLLRELPRLGALAPDPSQARPVAPPEAGRSLVHHRRPLA